MLQTMIIILKFRLIFTFVRFKPFFPYQALQGFEEDEELIHIQQWALTEGRLKVTLLECSRYVLCFLFTTCGQESMIDTYLRTVYSVFMLVYIVLFLH